MGLEGPRDLEHANVSFRLPKRFEPFDVSEGNGEKAILLRKIEDHADLCNAETYVYYWSVALGGCSWD